MLAVVAVRFSRFVDDIYCKKRKGPKGRPFNSTYIGDSILAPFLDGCLIVGFSGLVRLAVGAQVELATPGPFRLHPTRLHPAPRHVTCACKYGVSKLCMVSMLLIEATSGRKTDEVLKLKWRAAKPA